MTDLLELAARCEAAEASAQRALLKEAYKLIFGGPECIPTENFPGYKSPRWDRFHRMLDAEAYESAAMTLIDEDTFFHVSRFSPDEGQRGQAHVYPNRHVGDDYEGSAATPALALTAAALRARSASHAD